MKSTVLSIIESVQKVRSSHSVELVIDVLDSDFEITVTVCDVFSGKKEKVTTHRFTSSSSESFKRELEYIHSEIV